MIQILTETKPCQFMLSTGKCAWGFFWGQPAESNDSVHAPCTFRPCSTLYCPAEQCPYREPSILFLMSILSLTETNQTDPRYTKPYFDNKTPEELKEEAVALLDKVKKLLLSDSLTFRYKHHKETTVAERVLVS